MAIKSVYAKNGYTLKGDATITLTAEERMIIANALTICSAKEVNILPILSLVDKVVTAK